MNEPPLLVCERRSWWGPALRRLLPGTAVAETRTLDQCWERLHLRPRRFLFLEAAAWNLQELVHRLPTLPRFGGQAAAAVVMPRELHEAQWLLREAGAVGVACDALQLSQLARMSQRHLERAPLDTLPDSPRERIWRRLPWPAYAHNQKDPR